MSKKRTTIVVVVALFAGIVSFFNARMTALSKQNRFAGVSQQWLMDAPLNVAETEAKFNDEVDELVANLKLLQKSLAIALEDPCTPDKIVLRHVDSVNEAHGHLIRQVGEHVIRLRHKLVERNREHLMQFCAEAVSGSMSRLGARISGRDGSIGRRGQGGQGYRYGQQGRAGRNNGYRGGDEQGIGGYGQRFRFWDRLANRLRLTSEQVMILQENDPNFEFESIDLSGALLAERQKLISLFENYESNDEELLRQIDEFISTHNQIERRIAEHVLVLRPYLTIEQQKWLIGLCRRFENGQ